MRVSKEVAQLLCGELDVGDKTTDWYESAGDWEPGVPNVKKVHSEMIDTSRWSHIHEVVYEDLTTGKFWHSTYSTGATECQDERAYEHDGEVIEFDEVVPVEVTTIEYRSV